MGFAAHFLDSKELACSPPNEAIVSALQENGFKVDLFAPGGSGFPSCYDRRIQVFPVEYSKRWLAKNAILSRWRKYDIYSGTSEDPMGAVGVLSWLYRKRSFCLADEIKNGSYRGDAPESWKKLCRWAMRRSEFNIVNDESRIEIQMSYAGIEENNSVIVYPGCFRNPPEGNNVQEQKKIWGVPNRRIVISHSGAFNITGGAEWIFEAMDENPSLFLILQPMMLDPLTRALISNVRWSERVYIEEERLGWYEAWSTMNAVDVGVVVYLNPAPQFRNMGTSSNKLCMYLAMGVPVIASRQPSFRFIEEYGCGILVEDAQEFSNAVDIIASRLEEMKANALTCAREYIDAPGKYERLKSEIGKLL